MPRLTGIFEQFIDLDKVTPFELLTWLKSKVEIHYLVNFLGNRMLYPQTTPLTRAELEIDLAILREGLKRNPGVVYDLKNEKLVIPEQYIERFPGDLLIPAIIEAISPKGVNKIYKKGSWKTNIIGSSFAVEDPGKLSSDNLTVPIELEGVKSNLDLGKLVILKFEKNEGILKIAGKELTVFGGEFGLLIDLRIPKNE